MGRAGGRVRKSQEEKSQDPFLREPTLDQLPIVQPKLLWQQGHEGTAKEKMHVDSPLAVVDDKVLVGLGLLDIEKEGDRALFVSMPAAAKCSGEPLSSSIPGEARRWWAKRRSSPAATLATISNPSARRIKASWPRSTWRTANDLEQGHRQGRGRVLCGRGRWRRGSQRHRRQDQSF